jgi:hypothetical protein
MSKDFEWTLPTSSTTEGPTFYILADNGISMMTQMVYSSMNSWSPTVQLVARAFLPNGEMKSVTLTKGYGELILSEDKRSATCGPMSVEFFEFGYKVQLQDGDFEYQFETKSLTEPFKVGSGKHFFQDDNESKGWVQSTFLPKQTVVGTMKIQEQEYDLKGFVLSTFVQQHLPQNVALWNFCDFQSEKDALMLYQFHMPNSYEKKQVSQGCLVLNGKLEAITVENSTVFHDEAIDEFSGYKVPKSLDHEWKGTTMSGEPIQIKMSLNLQNLVDKIDVLGELPYLVRKFIQTFITAPYVYQWVEDTTVVVTKGSETIEIKGRVFHENAFVSQF